MAFPGHRSTQYDIVVGRFVYNSLRLHCLHTRVDAVPKSRSSSHSLASFYRSMPLVLHESKNNTTSWLQPWVEAV